MGILFFLFITVKLDAKKKHAHTTSNSHTHTRTPAHAMLSGKPVSKILAVFEATKVSGIDGRSARCSRK